MKLKKAIAELKMEENETVFLHIHSKTDEVGAILVKNIDSKFLNKEIKCICPHFGGQEYGYNCYRFILE